MKNKTKYIVLISLLIFDLLLFCASAVLTEFYRNLWWTILITVILLIVLFVFTIIIYMKHIEFICAKCETQFKAKNKDIILAIHTPTKRYLRCPSCGEESWCKETFIEKDNKRD